MFQVKNLSSVPTVLPSPVEAVGGISESEIQKARSQLKPSRSFPNDFKNNGMMNQKIPETNNHLNEEGDNSSSGVSSDQVSYLCRLTISELQAVAVERI